MPIIDFYQIFGLAKYSSTLFLFRKARISGSESALLKPARPIVLHIFGPRYGIHLVIKSKLISKPERNKLNTIEAFVAFLAR